MHESGEGSLVQEQTQITINGTIELANNAGSTSNYHFKSGSLYVNKILTGEGNATFVWDSGDLVTEEIDLPITNTAGTLSLPENSKKLVINGDYGQGENASLTLTIDDKNEGEYQQIEIKGKATFGGSLIITTNQTVTFNVGTTLNIGSWTSRTGDFASISLPDLPEKMSWDIFHFYATGELLVLQDTDEDGVEDRKDPFPEDPNKALSEIEITLPAGKSCICMGDKKSRHENKNNNVCDLYRSLAI